MYEAPFEYIRARVQPRRQGPSADPHSAATWWLHQRTRPEFWHALGTRSRYIATIRHSKHRLFVWLPRQTIPDSALIAFARDDDFTFGVLHSRVHELWARGTGTQVREVESGFRYTPTSTFETFPFPVPTDEQREAIAVAARRLVDLRDGWLNPSGFKPDELAERTLTNLYNERPMWLEGAHADLDRTVSASYGWPGDLADGAILERLMALNLERAPV